MVMFKREAVTASLFLCAGQSACLNSGFRRMTQRRKELPGLSLNHGKKPNLAKSHPHPFSGCDA